MKRVLLMVLVLTLFSGCGARKLAAEAQTHHDLVLNKIEVNTGKMFAHMAAQQNLLRKAQADRLAATIAKLAEKGLIDAKQQAVISAEMLALGKEMQADAAGYHDQAAFVRDNHDLLRRDMNVSVRAASTWGEKDVMDARLTRIESMISTFGTMLLERNE